MKIIITKVFYILPYFGCYARERLFRHAVLNRRTCPKRVSSTGVLDFLWWGRTDSICIFFLLGRKLWCHARLDGHEQLSTGQLRLDGFESLPLCKTKQPTPKGVSCYVAVLNLIYISAMFERRTKYKKVLRYNSFLSFGKPLHWSILRLNEIYIFVMYICRTHFCVRSNIR